LVPVTLYCGWSLNNFSMRNITLISVLFVLLSMGTILVVAAQENNRDYTLKASAGKFLYRDGVKTFFVPVTLTNNTGDTLKYISMSCSWYEFYHLNNPNLHYQYWGCDKNIPVLLKLAPHESKQVELEIVGKKRENKFVKFKVGIDLIKSDERQYLDYFSVNRSGKVKANTVWSNEIEWKD
jgi:hypothetical protein